MEKKRTYVGEKGKQILDYNAPQVGESHDENAMRVEYWIAKQIGTHLMKHYPNRQWGVDVDVRNHIIVISCPSLSKRMGYRLHIGRDTVVDLLPRCRKAAGEILERYGVSRARIIDPMTLEAFPRDVRDDAISKDAAATVEKWNRA
jgi:hypothetical protein